MAYNCIIRRPRGLTILQGHLGYNFLTDIYCCCIVKLISLPSEMLHVFADRSGAEAISVSVRAHPPFISLVLALLFIS